MNKVMHNTTLSLLGVTILSSLLLSSTHVFSDTEVIDEVRLTVPVACTMSGTGTTHTATLNPGTYSGTSGNEYENGIGKTTLTAICNDDNGFSIYAIGFTGNEYGVTNLVGQNTSGTIATKAYASGDTTSNWSMKLTKITDSTESYNPTNLTITTGYDDYHAVPSTYTKVAQYKANTGSSTTDTTLGVKLETTYAAFIASNQPADTYIGQVKYTMVHPYDDQPLRPQTTEAGCIRYYANGSNVEGTMGCQPVTSSDTSLTLLASNFSRTGYGFAGWSDQFDYATNSNANLYGPQEDITFTAGQYTGTNPGLSLYAIWIKSEGSIQDSTKVSQICNRLTESGPNVTKTLNSVSALTDERDNETYAIAKLADGNCWMIENMRLENTGTDNTNGSLAQGYNASFAGLADPEAASLFTSTATANTLYSTDGSTDKTISGSNQGYRFPRYNNINTPTTATDRPSNPTSNSATNNTTNASMYSYGNYYTWAAAIADTTNYSTNNQSITNTSICPTGWHLPKGGNNQNTANNEFLAFSEALIGAKPANYDLQTYPYYTGTPEGTDASNALRAYPNNFVYSGFVSSGSVVDRGSYGNCWSSTARSDYNAYLMYFNSSNVNPGTSTGYKYNGWSIRCLVPSA